MVYVFLADGFEEVEALATVDFLRRCSVPVTIAGVGGEFITGSHSITVKCDCVAERLSPDASVQAVVLPGGMPGTINLDNSAVVSAFIDYCVNNNVLLCAICAAPSILGKRGLLEGREAICFPGFEKELKGAVISDKTVVKSGDLITAKGAGVALQFGREIASQLVGKEKAYSVWESLQHD